MKETKRLFIYNSRNNKDGIRETLTETEILKLVEELIGSNNFNGIHIVKNQKE